MFAHACRRLAVFVSLGLVLLGSTAQAQGDQRPINLNRFRAAPFVDDAFALSRPDDLGDMRFGAQLHLDYSNDPLVWVSDSGDETRIVEHQLTMNVALSLGIADLLSFYAGLPVHLVMSGDDPPADTIAGADGAGAGDFYLGMRARLYGERDDFFSFAAQATVTAPSGVGMYGGDEKLSVHLQMLPELRLGLLRVTLNAGLRFRERQVLWTNTDLGHELTYALGLSAPLYGNHMEPGTSRLDIHAQVYGATSLSDAFSREETWVEAIGGLKLHHELGVVVGAAGGMGITRGIGSPDARVILTVGYVKPPERAPQEEEAPLPALDTDADGIPDESDECPNEAEDVDEFEDDNGCPDPDNDNDNIPDESDECPNEQEDPDGFEDEDGCPDRDNDGDGIRDADDPCMLQAEDFDQFRDEDGCPDHDNDLDDVADEADRCPNEAGSVGNHGCPDTDRDGDAVVDRLDNCPDEPGTVVNQGCQARQQVRITESRLEILDKVYFARNRARIRSRSHGLLNNVAAVINAHPELGVIRIEGHTDSSGDAAWNRELSQNRANAVHHFLIQQGNVAPERLEAIGYGPDQPVEDNSSEAGRAANRRVEFKILSQVQPEVTPAQSEQPVEQPSAEAPAQSPSDTAEAQAEQPAE